MAAFPATLPKPLASPYSLSPVDQTIRTDMEGGAARTRRRTSARNDKVSVTWRMTDAQLAILRAWFEDSTTGISGGAGWFTVSLPIGTTGLVSVEARFIGPFKASNITALIWSVTAELEVR
jgi:hypothetical protein